MKGKAGENALLRPEVQGDKKCGAEDAHQSTFLRTSCFVERGFDRVQPRFVRRFRKSRMTYCPSVIVLVK